MAQLTLYSPEASGLRLGPGVGNVPIKGELIVFQEGYASFDDKDYPHWRDWLQGAPHIEILDSSAGEVPATGAEFVCDQCSKAFASKAKLNGHRLSHRPRKP